jgi:hypothetical protein
MAQIINLRQKRKEKARADKDVRAEQNRIAFGRTKAERTLTESRKELEAKRLDAHRRDDESE